MVIEAIAIAKDDRKSDRLKQKISDDRLMEDFV
jgi:hypothetical protein